jgi:hypothetical protein
MSVVGRETGECGGLMIASALRLLREHRAGQKVMVPVTRKKT